MRALGPVAVSVSALCWGAIASAQGASLVLPSGVEAELHDTVWDEDLSALRMRYVVPQLLEPDSLYHGDAMRVFEDMQWLCETQVPALFPDEADAQEEGWNVAVISLMSRPIEFGTRDADTLQLFEWFTLTMDGCELELDEYHE
ncbi:DUF6497 family protein [Roseinatronobacter monicus]|uniref:DUF6497 family protein n=1 Tax=Roseinatronobacter monicus TaxID=393481 RepID=UPI003F3B7C41